MEKYLEYGNIELRPLEPEDIELLYKWENDSSLWEFSNSKTPFSKHILRIYIENSFKDIYEAKQLRLIIQTKDKRPVGAIDLFDFDPYHQRAGIGILIYKNEDRRQGFASDALQALENYSYNVVGIRQLYANISADNTTSISLFKKAGFIEVGVKKDWLKTTKGWNDELLLQKILQ